MHIYYHHVFYHYHAYLSSPTPIPITIIAFVRGRQSRLCLCVTAPIDDMYNVKNLNGSLTTVVRAQNDTSKTANITDTMFDKTYWYSPYKRRRFENR